MTEHNDNAVKIAWIQGLLVACPMQKALDDCPANELRKLPLADRMRFVKKMSNKELDSVIEHHKKCIHKRENDS